MTVPKYELDLRSSPSALRNREPILSVLKQTLPKQARVLEIASGTGEHAAYFATHGQWRWQCSDVSRETLESVSHWTQDAPAILQPPLQIDVMKPDWFEHPAANGFDVIYCANMIHIAPIEALHGLVAGTQRLLAPDGLLILYGPFRFGAHHSAPSNAQFDASLKARDPRWGLRDLGDVVERMRQHQLVHEKTHTMPANNLCVVFKRQANAPTSLPSDDD